jgi:hypothetical protein
VTEDVSGAVTRIRAWGEERDWRGYDPYDALNSPAARVLTLGTPLGRRLLTQAVKLSPVNVRPLLRVTPAWNAKALGLVASAYARLWAEGGDESAREEAERLLVWLTEHHAGPGDSMAWSYHFSVQTRFFAYDRDTPNTIATSFVAHAFLDAAELFGEKRWGEPVLAAARYLVSRMLVDGHFRYVPHEDELIHNANALACAVLARAGRLLGEESLLEPARNALAATLAAQRSDGSWPYAEGPSGDWVDNFHTAYVLESLAHCVDLHPEALARLERGLDYWQRALFLSDGTPKYFPHRIYPIDAHCYASAIDAWLAASEYRPEGVAQAERIAQLLIERMLDGAGFVHFQQRRFWASRVPFVRWTTAPAFRALAGVLLERARRRRREQADARMD